MKKRTIAAAASVALMVAAAFTPAANAANGVQPNKDSITAWVDQTSIAGMNTRQTAFDGSVITCKIATSQASDCLSVSPGSPDSQTVTNAAATRLKCALLGLKVVKGAGLGKTADWDE